MNAGDNVSVTATFSEVVNVNTDNGTPTLTLAVGSDNRTAVYASGDNSTALVFRYTIVSGDTDTNGISIRENALDNNSSRLSLGTSYTNIAGNSGPDNQTANYEIDTKEPTVSSVEITHADG